MMSSSHRPSIALLFLFLFSSVATGWTQADLPANIDNNLRRVIAADHQKAAARFSSGKRPGLERSMVRDSERRVLVEIHLNGKVSLETVRAQVTQLGGNVVHESASYRQG